MIFAVWQIPDKESLPVIHGVLEHTIPKYERTFLIAFQYDEEPFQQIYSGVKWEVVRDRLLVLCDVKDEGTVITVILVNAVLIDHLMPEV